MDLGGMLQTLALAAQDTNPTDMLLGTAGAIGASAGAVGIWRARARRRTPGRGASFTREEAEAVVRRLEARSHRLWTNERREQEILHILARHRK